jgi:hypothetical protein
VSEIAEKIGKSKTSVYKKVNGLKGELKPFRKKVNGVIYFDTEGFEIIKNSYGEVIIDNQVERTSLNHVDDKYLDLLLSEKDEQIKHLKEQLKEKGKSLDQAMKLVENNQVLLLQKEDKILMLESSSEKKSFWDKFKSDKGGK